MEHGIVRVFFCDVVSKYFLGMAPSMHTKPKNVVEAEKITFIRQTKHKCFILEPLHRALAPETFEEKILRG